MDGLYARTDEMILDMLGATYGRSEALASPPAVLTDMGIMLDTFHFLRERVNATLETEGVSAWLESLGGNYIEDAEMMLAQIDDETYGGCTATLGWVNSYNHEDLLSDVIQFCAFTIDADWTCPTKYTLEADDYIVLQIHRGGDLRGNYSAPRIFRLPGGWQESGILDFGSADLMCAGSEVDPQLPGQMTLEGEEYAARVVQHAYSFRDGYIQDGHDVISGRYLDVKENPPYFDESGHAACPECGTELRVYAPAA